MKKKIGFVGPFSTANFGDWSMLVNNIYDLKTENPIIFTYSPRFPKQSLREYIEDINVKYIEVKLKDSVESTNVNNPTPLDALVSLDNASEVYEAINEIDILIVSGGGWINHFWSQRIDKLYKILIPIYIANQKQKQIVFTANGIGPFDETRELFRYFFGYIKGAKIAVRDNLYSMSHLHEVGVEGKEVFHLPDDLYLINQSIINKNTHIEILEKDYIVIEMFYPTNMLKKHEKILLDFSKKIYEKYGLTIVLLPFDLVQFGSEQAKYLHSIFEKSKLVDIDELGYLPMQDAYSIIKNAKLMITSRYHGLVLSLSAETPVIFRLYDKMGDFRYSYNKGLGMLRTAFDGIEFSEQDFLQIDLITILNNVENNLQDIVFNQKNIYSSKIFKQNKLKLKQVRSNYLQDILEQ
ncbi:polysaccharide pyruvyl transferase family protein [Paucisalibacillus sp. EB02]|uniref:polysaccharide pyruvyl transferase family protein n=1 Tax=Paucisalibacillus sp. EB02 TaxID=1347087 RepID=UPI0004AE96F8|nr:polysaccharide pyruvyl transferase family protein [Paucisalibacillus sp. EB02]